MSAASSSFAAGPDRQPPPIMTRSQLATIVSGVPTAGDLFPTPKSAKSAKSGGFCGRGRASPPAVVRHTPDFDTAKPQDLFPSPPATPTSAARQQNGGGGVESDERDADVATPSSRRGDADAMSPEGKFGAPAVVGRHAPATAGSDYKPPPMRRVEDAFQAAPDSYVGDGSAAHDTGAATGAHASPCNLRRQWPAAV